MRDYLLLDYENATIGDGKLRKYRGDAVHIRIPDDVHTILTPAFTAKMKIQSLFFGKSMKEFSGEYSFLEAIEVDAENPHYTAIDGVLFDKKGEVLIYYPKGKKDRFYQVPEHVKEVKERAFYNNPYLNEVHISNSVSRIGKTTFFKCTNLEKVRLPQALEVIEECLFWDSNLKEIVIPENVSQIGSRAFQGNKNLQCVVLPKGLAEISENCFADCINLTCVDLPENLKKIGNRAFCNTGLTSVVFPNKISEVGEWSFGKCPNLTEVKLPKVLEAINQYAFFGSDQLRITLPRELQYETTMFLGCGEPIYAECFTEEEDENEQTPVVSEESSAIDEMIKQLDTVVQMYEAVYNMYPEQQKKNAKIITDHRNKNQDSLTKIEQELAKLSSDLRIYKGNLNECGFALWGEKARKRKQFASLVEETQNKLQQCTAKRTTAMLNLHKIPMRPIAYYTSAGHNIKLYPTNQLDATFAIEYDGELLVYNACELSLADSNVNAQMDASELDKAILTGIAAGSFAGYVATSVAQTYGNISEISLTLFDAENSSYKKIVFAANAKLTSQEYSKFASDYDQFAEKFGKMMVNISQDEVGTHNLIKSGLVDSETK